jgi:apolipoprotein D and lipocalin family protein
MSLRRLLWATAVALAAVLGAGCTGLPAQVQPVGGFELNRHLGTWHEIARLDHSFERGLSQVSAQYSLRDDGGVRVINRGFDAAKGTWKQAEGKAYFVGAADTAHLKVSFFGPFYGTYAVFELDKAGYQHAFVSGPNTDYLWLLARTPTVAPELKQGFVDMARARGFDTSRLIWLDQPPPNATRQP